MLLGHAAGITAICGASSGASILKDLLRCCKDWSIGALTVYAFSTENWRRPTEEVDCLMRLFERLLRKELAAMHQAGVRIRFLGDLSTLHRSLRQEIARSTAATATNTAIEFNVAINYGSRSEIIRACREVATQIAHGAMAPAAITEELLERHLDTASSCDPDLLIRTSGEQRLSNFLLWQLAYTELYFTDAHWPEFDRGEFHQALLAFQKRDRRFGTISQTAMSKPSVLMA